MSVRLVPFLFVALISAVFSGLYFQHYQLSRLLRPIDERQNDTKRDQVAVPKIVWLMSFPNSGTSYTSTLLRTLTRHTLGTNYGENHFDANGNSVPISDAPEFINGPFRSSISPPDSVDGKYVLTKTHCGGRCSRCGPKHYLETADSFRTACLKARRRRRRRDNGVSTTQDYEYENCVYDEKLVEKAIHLVRNPFDNVVSRFHLHLKRTDKRKAATELVESATSPSLPSRTPSPSPRTSKDYDDFLKWCKKQDARFKRAEQTAFSPTLIELFDKIPCHADFFRYIQWHGLAFDVVKGMDIPSLVVHYEDYDGEFDGTKDDLLYFLEQDEVTTRDERPLPFVSGKEYGSYFTSVQKEHVRLLVEEIGSEDTKEMIERYFLKKVHD